MSRREIRYEPPLGGGQPDSVATAMSYINANFTESYQEIVTTNRTYYVNPTTGVDENTGLSVSAPFRTIQKAVDVVCTYLFVNAGVTVTIQLADGTHSLTSVAIAGLNGPGSLVIKGNTSNPENVIVSGTAAVDIFYSRVGLITLDSFEIRSAAPAGSWTSYIKATFKSTIYFKNIRFGSSTTANNIHLLSDSGGCIKSIGAYSIVASCAYHLYAVYNGKIEVRNGHNATVASGISFSGFALAVSNSVINDLGSGEWTYSSITGLRYWATLNSAILTAAKTASATHFPGNSNGSAISGAVYA